MSLGGSLQPDDVKRTRRGHVAVTFLRYSVGVSSSYELYFALALNSDEAINKTCLLTSPPSIDYLRNPFIPHVYCISET